MKVSQIHEILNTITKENLGEETIVNEDLSNIVELGKQFSDVMGLDNYVRKLNDVIGKMIFVNRVYKGRVPSVLMDGWEYGSIVEKVSARIPDATENESWELENGTSYDPNIFYKPEITVSLWNNKVTFEIPISFTEMQVKSSFNSPEQLNSFISMIYTAIENSMTVKLDALIMRTINNFIGVTVANAYPGANYTGVGNARAVNVLALYNAGPNAGKDPLTFPACLHVPDFIKFASETWMNYKDRLGTLSKLFNIGGEARFTPEDKLHVVMLSEFKHAADVYLQSGVYNEEYTKLPNAELVPYWQGSGTAYSISDTSTINIKTSDNHSVVLSGILGVMFDRDALGVVNQNPRVTTQYNAKAEFWNEWHKFDAGYFNDTNENFVVFFAA